MISQLFSLQVQKRSANFCFLQGKRQHSCSNRQTYHEVHCNFCCLIKSSQACNTIPKVQDHYSREDVTTVKVIALRVGFLRRRPGIKKHTTLLPSSKSSKKKEKRKKDTPSLYTTTTGAVVCTYYVQSALSYVQIEICLETIGVR